MKLKDMTVEQLVNYCFRHSCKECPLNNTVCSEDVVTLDMIYAYMDTIEIDIKDID